MSSVVSPKRSSVPCCSCPSPWLPATGARGEKPDCGAEVKCSCSPHPSTAVPCCAFLGLPCCWKRQLSVQPQLSKIAITVIIMPQSKHRWTTAGLKLVVGNTGEVYCFRSSPQTFQSVWCWLFFEKKLDRKNQQPFLAARNPCPWSRLRKFPVGPWSPGWGWNYKNTMANKTLNSCIAMKPVFSSICDCNSKIHVGFLMPTCVDTFI